MGRGCQVLWVVRFRRFPVVPVGRGRGLSGDHDRAREAAQDAAGDRLGSGVESRRGDAQGVDGGEQSGRVEWFAERCCGSGDRPDEGPRVEDVPRSVVAAADEIAASAGDALVVFGEPCADVAVDRIEVVVAAGCPVWCVGRFHGCAVLLDRSVAACVAAGRVGLDCLRSPVGVGRLRRYEGRYGVGRGDVGGESVIGGEAVQASRGVVVDGGVDRVVGDADAAPVAADGRRVGCRRWRGRRVPRARLRGRAGSGGEVCVGPAERGESVHLGVAFGAPRIDPYSPAASRRARRWSTNWAAIWSSSSWSGGGYCLDVDDELAVQRIEYVVDHPDVLDAAAVDALTTCLALARRVAQLPTPIGSAAGGEGVEHVQRQQVSAARRSR